MTDEKKEIAQKDDTEGLYDFAMPRSEQLLAQSTEEPAESTDTEEATTPDETVEEVVDEATKPDEEVGEGESQVEDDTPEPERYVIPYKANGEEREFEYQLDEEGRLSADTIVELSKRLAMEGLHEKVQKVQEDKKASDASYQSRLADQQAMVDDYKARFESIKPLHEAVQRDPRLLGTINQQYRQQMGGQQIRPYDSREADLRRQQVQVDAQRDQQTIQGIEVERWDRFRKSHADFTEDDFVAVREFYEENAGVIDRVPLNENGIPVVPIESLRAQLLDSPEIAVGMMMAKGKFKPKADVDKQKLEQKLDIAKTKAGLKNPSAGGKGTVKAPTYVQKGWHELTADERRARIKWEQEKFSQETAQTKR